MGSIPAGSTILKGDSKCYLLCCRSPVGGWNRDARSSLFRHQSGSDSRREYQKIDKFLLVDFYFFTIHYSLFTTQSTSSFFISNSLNLIIIHPQQLIISRSDTNSPLRHILIDDKIYCNFCYSVLKYIWFTEFWLKYIIFYRLIFKKV